MANFEVDEADNVPHDSDACWICYSQFEDEKSLNPDIISLGLWVAPCKCKGTAMWVHQECLQKWIDEKQKGDASRLVRCHQCHTGYRYKYPPLDKLAIGIQYLENLVDVASPYACFCASAATGYFLLTGYGYFTLIQIAGYEEAMQLTKDNEVLVWISLPFIPLILTLTKFARIEDFLFKYLKRCIPSILTACVSEKHYHKLWPQPPRAPTEVATRRHISLTRAVISALMLPTISYVIGNILFFNVKNNLKRSLCGAATYQAVRMITKLYLKFRSYQKMCYREILNYRETS